LVLLELMIAKFVAKADWWYKGSRVGGEMEVSLKAKPCVGILRNERCYRKEKVEPVFNTKSWILQLGGFRKVGAVFSLRKEQLAQHRQIKCKSIFD
jgi:hypothetical protein